MRRGEKAVIRIWMPIPPSTKQLEKWQAAGADPAEKPRTRYKLGPVWDRSQVDPLPPPAESVPLDPPITEPDGDTLAWTLPPLSELVAELGCTLIYEDHPAGRGGSFTPSTKQISINRANAVNHQVKTLIHEVIHALGVDYQHYSRAQAEVIVDTTTLVVLGGLGLDISGETVPYIAGWGENGRLCCFRGRDEG